MPDRIESLIKKVFKEWKESNPKPEGPHPDEEIIASLIEGKLSKDESESVKAHMVSCDNCSRNLAILAKLVVDEGLKVPEAVIERARDLVKNNNLFPALEIAVKLKEHLLELVYSTGDILFGQELVPSPVLRSRNIKDFKSELVALKDFGGIRVEVKIVNKRAKFFDLSVSAKEKDTQKEAKNLRISLFRDGLEIESYYCENGSAVFENVAPGQYSLEISGEEEKLATVSLDIKAEKI